MHVAAVMLFEGSPACARPAGRGDRRARCTSVPRCRQRLAWHVPLGTGPAALGRRPPPQPPATTCAATALPAPGSEEQLKDLAGRVFSRRSFDRDKPLWEIWLVEGLDGGDRFAAPRAKTHHALVDGVSGDGHRRACCSTPPPEPARAGRRPASPGSRARCPAARPAPRPKATASSAPPFPAEVARTGASGVFAAPGERQCSTAGLEERRGGRGRDELVGG